MSELDISIVTIFKQYYPNIDHTTLDNNVLATLIENMFSIERSKYSEDSEDSKDSDDLEDDSSDSDEESNPIIEENYSKANELIPGMIESGDLVSVRGRLNQIPVNILFDSGCQTSGTFTSVIKKVNLEHLVDKKARTYCTGINGPTKTFGMIWFTELEFETENLTENYISFPIKLSILDDSKNKNKKQEKSDSKSDSNSDSEYEFVSKNPIDILVGTDFMKSTYVMINFNKKIITLNDVEIIYK
jgi:hypothetical protein